MLRAAFVGRRLLATIAAIHLGEEFLQLIAQLIGIAEILRERAKSAASAFFRSYSSLKEA